MVLPGVLAHRVGGGVLATAPVAGYDLHVPFGEVERERSETPDAEEPPPLLGSPPEKARARAAGVRGRVNTARFSFASSASPQREEVDRMRSCQYRGAGVCCRSSRSWEASARIEEADGRQGRVALYREAAVRRVV